MTTGSAGRDAATTSFDERYEHLRWLSVHGGGDELADANCWNDVKGSLAQLLDIAELAESLTRDLRKQRYLSREGAATVAECFQSALARLEASRG